MGAAIFTGESDIAAIMMKAGLGMPLRCLLSYFRPSRRPSSTSYSAGVSSVSISGKMKEKPAAVAVCIVGILLCYFYTRITQFEEFLYLIGSVFAPMIAVQIVDYFILHKDSSAKSANWINLVLWLIGFIMYRIFIYASIRRSAIRYPSCSLPRCYVSCRESKFWEKRRIMLKEMLENVQYKDASGP